MLEDVEVLMQTVRTAIFRKVSNTDCSPSEFRRSRISCSLICFSSKSLARGNICKNCHVIQNPLLHGVSGFAQYAQDDFKEIFLETQSSTVAASKDWGYTATFAS